MGRWEENLKLYDQLVLRCERFKRKGKTMPYTSANGYMFSLLNKDGDLGIRFSKPVQTKYMKSLNTTVYKSYNAIMKGYILLPESLLKNESKVVELLNESYDYVMSLPPK